MPAITLNQRPRIRQSNRLQTALGALLPQGRQRDGDPIIELYAREIGEVRPLTEQEELALTIRIRKGEKPAREQLLKGNLRRVVQIARDYQGLGLSLLDLVSEGNLGLIRAVDRFDPASGLRFSAYSARYIRQSIRQALPGERRGSSAVGALGRN